MNELDLHEHNRIGYEKVKNGFLTSNRCCVVHPTGTGKSYICLALFADHRSEKILYVTSYAKDLQLMEDKMKEYLGDYNNITTCLYSGLDRLPFERYDYIILNEMHRAGATDWERMVKTILSQCPDAKILGLTATPIRYLDNQRNMADELFDGNIVSELTLQDALLQGILPIPYYITGVYSYEEDILAAEQKLQKQKGRRSQKEYANAKKLLDKAKRALELSSGLDRIFKEKMQNPHGKYIVFCRNYCHMLQMIEKSKEWFSWVDTTPHVYKLHSLDHDADTTFDLFKQDDSDTLRLLFCINMLNEGVHIPGIDGVICFRPTESPNVYQQQIGRALCTGNAEHPYIFDIVNNVSALTPVREYWHGIIHAFQAVGQDIEEYFEVYARDMEITTLLDKVNQLTSSASWEDYYALCKRYYLRHGSLAMSKDYEEDGLFPARWLATQRRRYNGKVTPPITQHEIDLLNEIGMDWDPRDLEGKWEYWYQKLCDYKKEHNNLDVPGISSGPYIALYRWTNNQRYRKRGVTGLPPLTDEQVQKLEAIGFQWEIKSPWEKACEIAEKYYQQYGTLDLKKAQKFEGFGLGAWIHKQRAAYSRNQLAKEQIARLNKIHMIWELNVTKSWDDIILLLESYKKEFGDINMPAVTKYKGYGLGYWISKVRTRYRNDELSVSEIEELNNLGMQWDTRPPSFEDMYQLAETYYKEHGNLRVPCSYTTNGGIKLGSWISLQRRRYFGKAKGSLPHTKEQIKLLEGIGMEWSLRIPFDTFYECAKKYYAEHGNLDLPQKAVVDGLKLGSWASEQKRRLKDPKRRATLSEEKMLQLQTIGIVS